MSPAPPGDEPAAPTRRVRVTAPRSSAAVTPGRFTVSRELAEQSAVGELFVRSLIRSQLRLALVIAVAFLAILLGFPLVLAAMPALQNVTVFTVPVTWLVLGFGIYPVIIGGAALYVRGAARNEARFRELVDDKDER